MDDLLRVEPGFTLATIDPDATPGFTGGKAKGLATLAKDSSELSTLQEMLFAESMAAGGIRSVLLVLQGMDTSGKGGIVRHVVGAVDPQGVAHYAFKEPTAAELRHDFLWRVRRRLPGKGLIGVFDRSHYEDVLIQRVRQMAPPDDESRYDLINEFEAEVAASGTSIIKVMLHISSDEQKARLLQRLERPDKHWKFNPRDIDERALWPKYAEAYQIALDRTSTDVAPWHVIPANKKWYARLAAQKLLITTLRSLGLQWPTGHFDVEAEKKRLEET